MKDTVTKKLGMCMQVQHRRFYFQPGFCCCSEALRRPCGLIFLCAWPQGSNFLYTKRTMFKTGLHEIVKVKNEM